MSITLLAQSIQSGKVSAFQHCTDTIRNLKERDASYNCVTKVVETRALQTAKDLDGRIARGDTVGPLAGVPFGVKDLFDLEGQVTTAGSVVLNNSPPATRDAEVVQRLCAAGAIPVASLNMDEFAYGFATENAHYGTTRNPHDPQRLAGGSSGGSAAAVAANLLPFTLGSDTNGSIRVPASLCGVWGLRPTQGLVPLAGVYPFASSLDVIGPFAQNVADIRSVSEVLIGQSLAYKGDASALSVGILDGWFAQDLTSGVTAGMSAIQAACQHTQTITLPEVARARAASFVITAAEGGNLHLNRLKVEPMAYDPATRDRLMAGALLPSAAVIQAQRVRNWFREIMHEAFRKVDILVAPATVGPAPRLDQPTIMVGGKAVSARANLGLFTQPLSLAGMPVLSAPLSPRNDVNIPLPLGVQFIAAPGKENTLLAFAEMLEQKGLLGFPVVTARN
ncbi:amidase [Acetobacter senegalensis]|uniref:Amidase n=2 Tax=Acetobacter TaxID=434 RepID=A0A252EHP7_9PROT|nr:MULTISPECIES: AtzE family amidohydrolase [Acetobacter]ATJ91605.1 AtzE family amidohydrolase [Acetobacter tropicalis]OUL65856.1 amidase [Acetobacter senegalensis]